MPIVYGGLYSPDSWLSDSFLQDALYSTYIWASYYPWFCRTHRLSIATGMDIVMASFSSPHFLYRPSLTLSLCSTRAIVHK